MSLVPEDFPKLIVVDATEFLDYSVLHAVNAPELKIVSIHAIEGDLEDVGLVGRARLETNVKSVAVGHGGSPDHHHGATTAELSEDLLNYLVAHCVSFVSVRLFTMCSR